MNELAEQSDLIVYSDGPKNDKDNDSVKSVRHFINNINGFKSLTIIERNTNWGLAANIIDGVTEIVNKFDRVIVLEDDLVTSPVFLSFMNQALEHFSRNEKVLQISGYMFDVDIEEESDAIFLPFISSWGWATWKRAWDHFDPLMSGYEQLKKDRGLQHKFNLEGAYNYFSMLEAQRKGKVDSWAIRWYLSVFLVEGLILYPVRSLVKNCGFDGSGTHCKGGGLSSTNVALYTEMEVSLIRFPDTRINKKIFKCIKLHLSSKQKIVDKLIMPFSKFFK